MIECRMRTKKALKTTKKMSAFIWGKGHGTIASLYIVNNILSFRCRLDRNSGWGASETN
jgi:hypothetical protein